MRKEEWARLMKQARHEALVNEDRRKVVAVRVSARAERLTGSKWTYVVQCGDECRICDNRRMRAEQAVL